MLTKGCSPVSCRPFQMQLNQEAKSTHPAKSLSLLNQWFSFDILWCLECPKQGCRKKKKNCPNPEFFPPTIVRRSAYIINLFKMAQKTLNATIWVQTKKKERFFVVLFIQFLLQKKYLCNYFYFKDKIRLSLYRLYKL